MATFKVGDKARIIDCGDVYEKHWVGCEVTILALPGWSHIFPEDYQISRPHTETGPGNRFGAPSHHLAPLTDPGADAFIERMKRLGREPVSDAPKVAVREK